MPDHSPAAPLTDQRAIAVQALGTLTATGGTALVDAVAAGLTLAGTSLVRSVTIVFSDGVDTASWMRPEAVRAAAPRANTVVYAVTTANRRDTGFLHDVASDTGGRVLALKAVDSLEATLSAILDEFRTRYVLSYTPQGVTSGGWHRIDVLVPNRRVSINARKGYFGG